MKIIKVTPRGYCKGVVNAINIAKQARLDYPHEKITILGMLVHNQFVVDALKQLNIETIEDKNQTRLQLLDHIDEGIVIFTAHGIAEQVIEKATQKGLKWINASCTDVIKTQNIVKEYLNKGYTVAYIGKAKHPEAEAVLALSDKVHLIESQNNLSYLASIDKLFVTNQTTMSSSDVLQLFESIAHINPSAVFSEEICNATQIRQDAIRQLKNVDILIVVGDIHSNNTARLAQIGKESGIPQVYLIEDCNDEILDKIDNQATVAITSGASTPTYLTNQVIARLENRPYDTLTNLNAIL